jgi:hypothetical protein
LHTPEVFTLCEKSRIQFDEFCAIQLIEKGRHYGGKICAALNRHHPRNLFNSKYFLQNSEFSEHHKEGLLLAVVISNQPIERLLHPHLSDQKEAFSNQFPGMINEPFNYFDFANARENLFVIIHESLTTKDLHFLLSIQDLNPDWSIYNFERFPSVLSNK